MKKICLLCNHEEGGYHKREMERPYVCSTCVQKILATDQAQLVEQYIKASDAAESPAAFRIAYALQSFMPKAVRQEHPLPQITKKDLLQLECIK